MKRLILIAFLFIGLCSHAQMRGLVGVVSQKKVDAGLLVGATRINPIPFTGFTKSGNNITKTSDGGVEWNQRMLTDGVYAVQWNPLMADCGMYLNGTNSSTSSPNFSGMYVVAGILYYEQNGGVEGAASTQPTTGAYIALRRVSGTLYLSYTYDLGATWTNAYTYGTITNTYLISSHFGSRTLYDPQGVGITTL
jgi:hypothetical protein